MNVAKAEHIIDTTAYDVVIFFAYGEAMTETTRYFEENTKAMDYLKQLARRATDTNTPVAGTVVGRRICSFAIQDQKALLVWDNPKSLSGQSSMSLL